ncbi:glycosyltransferase family 39 protein [Oscillatoria amoena NRMC-F 0135]|nr:glycosyltransferase family 39 protein [Oscillatoria amoena NRMC-F 0135]
MLLISWSWWGAEQQFLLRSDSGIFAYIGQQLAAGKRLYVDVWDHKPPLIYWWNALGCLLSPGSVKGIWFFACLHLSLGTVGFFLVMRRLVSPAVAALGAVLLAAALQRQLVQPNNTEVYALPWQVALLWIGLKTSAGTLPARWSAVAGLACAMLMATRPNNIGAGLWFAATLLCFVRPSAQLRQHLPACAAGFAAGAALILLPFLLNGSWPALLFASFTFNFAYSQEGSLLQKAGTAVNGLVQLTRSGVLPFAAAGAVAFWVFSPPGQRLRPGLLMGWFFLEMLLVSLSGRAYEQYFVMPLLAAVTLTVMGIAQWANTHSQRLPALAAMAFLFCYGLEIVWDGRSRSLYPLDSQSAQFERLRKFVGSSGGYYYWGNAPRHIWFQLPQPVPVALFHTTPMLANEGQYKLLAPGLLRDLLLVRPASLVEKLDSPSTLQPGPWDNPETAGLKEELLMHYEVIGQVQGERYWRLR